MTAASLFLRQGFEEDLQQIKNRVTDFLPPHLLATADVVYVTNDDWSDTYSESEIRSFCADIGIVRWKDHTVSENRRFLSCINSERPVASYFNPKWRPTDLAKRPPRLYVVCNLASIVTIMNGLLHGMIWQLHNDRTGILFYKYGINIGRRRFDDYLIDGIVMSKTDFDDYSRRVDAVLEPILVGPLRAIVRDFLPFL